MDLLIFKTNINSKDDFLKVRSDLFKSYNINECTVDLEDSDKVLRIAGYNLIQNDITSHINSSGFYCEELQD
jgi:hypothetical protein